MNPDIKASRFTSPRISREAENLLIQVEDGFNELEARHLVGKTLTVADSEEEIEITPDILTKSSYVFMEFSYGSETLSFIRTTFDVGQTKTFSVKMRKPYEKSEKKAEVSIDNLGLTVRYNPDMSGEEQREDNFIALESDGWLANPSDECQELLDMVEMPDGYVLTKAVVKLGKGLNNLAS